MEQARTVLIDTSLLIELQKRARDAAPVRAELDRYRFKGISSYSKLEFKRAWLQRLAYIHQLCLQGEISSVSDVWDVINRRLANSYQHRAVKTLLSYLSKFFELDAPRISQNAQIARLQAHAKNAVLTASRAIREAATAEFKGTGCVRAEEMPIERPNGSLDVTIRKCRPSDVQCTVHTFFEANTEEFAALADYVDRNSEQVSEELKTMRQHIRRAGDDRFHLCDDRHCVRREENVALGGRKT